jgi:hypothetical protein
MIDIIMQSRIVASSSNLSDKSVINRGDGTIVEATMAGADTAEGEKSTARKEFTRSAYYYPARCPKRTA